MSLGFAIAAGIVLLVGFFFWLCAKSEPQEHGGAAFLEVIGKIALHFTGWVLLAIGLVLGVVAGVVYLCGH